MTKGSDKTILEALFDYIMLYNKAVLLPTGLLLMIGIVLPTYLSTPEAFYYQLSSEVCVRTDGCNPLVGEGIFFYGIRLKEEFNIVQLSPAEFAERSNRDKRTGILIFLSFLLMFIKWLYDDKKNIMRWLRAK